MEPSCSCSSASVEFQRGLWTFKRHLGVPVRRLSRRRARRQQARQQVVSALPELHPMLGDLGTALGQHLTLAYERVTLPCSAMNCGDAIYRSTLDPVLRLEQKGLNPKGIALVMTVLLYLTATPGVLAGAIDYYITSKWQRLQDKNVFVKEDFKLGKKLATGGFGTVWRADLDDGVTPGGRPVIVKKAKEFGEAEVWMNERLMRAAPRCFAEFITAFEENGRSKAGQPLPLWLVWQYEGDYTLYDLMQKKDFPYNLEPLLLGQELALPKGPRRKAVTIQLVMQQVLEALKACHATGIVHRDVKPQNVIISQTDRRAKLIDLGAAADLRIGINYVPNEFLLDPRYAPPQQYIMSTQTPRAPPLPVAAALSPVLWRLNSPDRFDMYSAGMMLLQMAFPPLRSDNNLIAFNRKLQGYNYDLGQWRSAQRKRGSKEMQEGFQVLAQNGGNGWDLLASLVRFEPGKRLSARSALGHPWFGSGLLGGVVSALDRVGSSMSEVAGSEWLGEALSKSGTQRIGGLTEAQLAEELSDELVEEVPYNVRNASNTVAWWRGRQAVLNLKVRQKQIKLAKGLDKGFDSLEQGARSGIREGRKPFLQLFGGGRTGAG